MTPSPALSRRILLSACTAISLAGVPAAALAANVGVVVTDPNGKPLAEAVGLLESAAGKVAVKPMADAEISQSKRQFHPRITLVTVGTRVSFPNFDTVRHHVYSFSPTKTFELKLYAGVPNAPVTFDKPGVGVLGCNIHDGMAAWVVVADTPWSAQSGADGRMRIENVPAGAYRLKLWHSGLAPGTEPSTIALVVGAGDVEQTARLAVAPMP